MMLATYRSLAEDGVEGQGRHVEGAVEVGQGLAMLVKPKMKMDMARPMYPLIISRPSHARRSSQKRTPPFRRRRFRRRSSWWHCLVVTGCALPAA